MEQLYLRLVRELDKKVGRLRAPFRHVLGRCTRKLSKFVEDRFGGENESCCARSASKPRIRSAYKIGTGEGKNCGKWMFQRVAPEEKWHPKQFCVEVQMMIVFNKHNLNHG